MKKFVNSFTAFLFFALILISCKQEKINKPVQTPAIKKDTVVNVNISAVGDIMCHSTQINYARTKDGSLDFRPNFEIIKKYFASKDLVIGNLETTFAGSKRKYSGYPFFNTPDEFLDALKYAGFNILFTSNNHAFDQGKYGVLRTIKEIKKRGMTNLGTYKSQRDRDSIRVIDIKGIKLIILAYSYSTNGVRIPKGSEYLISTIDTSSIRSDLTKAKRLNPDLVLVYFHFGQEYFHKPTRFQRKIVEFTKKHGADIIIASHPHTLQPVETFPLNNSRLDSGFVAYSLGNFISNQRWRYSDGGAILNFSVRKNLNTNKIKINNLSFLPFWVYKGKLKNKNSYAVLPLTDSSISRSYPFLTPKDTLEMNQCISDVLDIMKKSTSKLKLLTVGTTED
ncbi:capsule biosynthesis protein CapA [bacterium BMS3Abin04]|nr:capsule biosynthesis protein CapA [bacterium BMS3Abin04]